MSKPSFAMHDGIYLLNHSVGRPPLGSLDSINLGFFEPWENGDAEVWPQWLAQIDNFRTTLGTLLNARMEDLCPQVNLSSALCKIIHSLPRKKDKNVILISEQDFPSMGFVVSQAQAAGFEPRIMPVNPNSTALDLWDEQLSDDVFCALITEVFSNTGERQPVAEISRLCLERGIFSVVDICQSVGVLPIDLHEWDADFVLGSCVKWLCGGPGAGYLWANPDTAQQCQPVDVGWFSHADPFEFDIHNFRYADGAQRFWGGTPSVIPYVLAANSITQLNHLGIDKIREHNIELTEQLITGLAPETLITPAQPSARGGTLVLNFGARQPKIVERLTSEKVRFDVRATGLRLSPHIYNCAKEMDIVLKCLQTTQ
ncbi:MAG: aminotransferase class V-fold PLP-dependent enzyme [Halioglobus sp.]